MFPGRQIPTQNVCEGFCTRLRSLTDVSAWIERDLVRDSPLVPVRYRSVGFSQYSTVDQISNAD